MSGLPEKPIRRKPAPPAAKGARRRRTAAIACRGFYKTDLPSVDDQQRIDVARWRLPQQDIVERAHAIDEHHRHATARIAVLGELVVLGLRQKRQRLPN